MCSRTQLYHLQYEIPCILCNMMIKMIISVLHQLSPFRFISHHVFAVTFCMCAMALQRLINLVLLNVHLNARLPSAFLPPRVKIHVIYSEKKASPQQHSHRKLRVPPYVGLSYHDNMFHCEVPAQWSSLHLAKNNIHTVCMKRKRAVTFCVEKKNIPKFAVYFRLWPAASITCASCTARISTHVRHLLSRG